MKLAQLLTIRSLAFVMALVCHQSYADPMPGTHIEATNVSEYVDLVHPAFAAEIAAGNFSLTVGDTFSLGPHATFVEANRVHGGSARLGDAPGELLGYIAGIPFPQEPDINDPRAGEKLAWNLRYSYGGDSGMIPEMYWYYRDMRRNKLERTLEFSARRYNFKHRVAMEPIPEVENNRWGLHSAILLEAHEPPDVSGTALLLFYNDEDRKVEQGWMYVPLLRRVRRIATQQKTDAFLGSDIMIEDFLGYSGRIMDMEWEYKGTTEKLLPIYKHTEVKASTKQARRYDYDFIDFSGPTQCLPSVPWQKRKVYVLEGSPKRRDHPLSKREFYIDAETYISPFGALYDRAGMIWKLGVGGISHPDHHLPENAGTGVPILDSSAMIDLQARHCTAIQMVTLVNSKKVKPRNFHPSVLDEDGR